MYLITYVLSKCWFLFILLIITTFVTSRWTCLLVISNLNNNYKSCSVSDRGGVWGTSVTDLVPLIYLEFEIAAEEVSSYQLPVNPRKINYVVATKNCTSCEYMLIGCSLLHKWFLFPKGIFIVNFIKTIGDNILMPVHNRTDGAMLA